MVGESVRPWQDTHPVLPAGWAESASGTSASKNLKSKAHIGGGGEQCSSGVNILESLERKERIEHGGDRNVLGERRPVRRPDTGICSEARMDRVLKQDQLQRLRIREADQIQIGDP